MSEGLYNTTTMNLVSSLESLSHHAYLLVGTSFLHTDLFSLLEEVHQIPIHANPDFYNRRYETFAIDDSREIRSLHDTRPIGISGKKIFILTMNGATVEAQNALLKLLEEPAEYAHFFLIVPSEHLLLPTIKSRMLTIRNEKAEGSQDESGKQLKDEAQKFLKLSPAKRLESVKKLMEDITKEKKTKQDAISFLNAIQAVVYEKEGVKKGMKALDAIEQARMYLNDRAPSAKMLLEYVALSI
jgi:DNA polymerase III delta prime subunit